MSVWTSSSALLLVAANLIPLAGVVLFGWSVQEVLLLFWLESAVIGGFNILKLLRVGGPGALPLCGFFSVHYGMFMFGHLLIVFTFTGGPGARMPDTGTVVAILSAFWPALLALVLSHGYSFFSQFIGAGEYRTRTLQQQMSEPYRRIMVMHITVLFGGFLVVQSGAPVSALVLLVLLKIAVDLRAHRREHATTSAATSTSAPTVATTTSTATRNDAGDR